MRADTNNCIDNQKDAGFDHNYEEMSPTEMLLRQLTIFRRQKNVDPSWKQQAKDGAVHPWILILYVASSFFYSAAGIVLLVHDDTLRRAVSSFYYPWTPFGIYFILQGFVTHCSDTVYIDRLSWWHPTDRICALCGILFTCSSLLVLLMNALDQYLAGIMVYLFGAILSSAAFALEWTRKAAKDIAGFALCHAAWHVFAPTGLIIMILTMK
ncbi:expressed unknown protein [Seminavis robusta]|uniref:Uncharacterized protein n=1 Tax=Seminavis robusta TaxID=568900 RepID=A0A9N8DMQ5_9STRA|nr:expressed unknown protein [Seminavis robusta]|eukprot:Sro141_g065700.1 n/a (211) ;mRNA; r:8873-9505